MYGIYTYIYHKKQPNVGKYTIHGSYGKGFAESGRFSKTNWESLTWYMDEKENIESWKGKMFKPSFSGIVTGDKYPYMFDIPRV